VSTPCPQTNGTGPRRFGAMKGSESVRCDRMAVPEAVVRPLCSPREAPERPDRRADRICLVFSKDREASPSLWLESRAAFAASDERSLRPYSGCPLDAPARFWNMRSTRSGPAEISWRLLA